MLLRLAALAVAVTVAVADTTVTCSASSKCPASSPCCSSYGECGTGAYCLGGCYPMASFNLASCMPAPICSSGDFKMTSLDGVQANTKYLGDASQANWVSSGTPAVYQDEAVLLTMPPNTVGTLLSSTHYVWYGKISASMTTSQGQGVVTAFIMMSDVKDEIDFEFVGVDLLHAQSNFYWQGVTNYNNAVNLSVSNTVTTAHTYEIDWTPDQIDWSIDGTVLRTLKKSDTYNTTDKQYHYPQTPARVQFSLWPAGLSTNGEGTIDWSGGLINWNSPYMQNGYYYAMLNEVNIECYAPPSGANVTGSKSYEYNNVLGINSTVVVSGDNTILSSFQANGNNQQLGAVASGSSTSSAASSSASANSNTVPGVSGAGSYGNDAASNTDGTTSSSSSSSSSSSGTFVQGTTSQAGGIHIVAGSVVACVAFLAAALMI